MSSRTLIVNVDDSPQLRYAKTRILQRAGYEVVEAGTGGEALRFVREMMPQLVLCDVALPDMSGVDVCRRIKNDPATGSIPVIQISATFVSEQDEKDGLKGGADIYLTEPLEPKELETVVSVLLRLRRTEAEALDKERAARAQAEEATRLKDEFLATLSHELRTPMNIIIGWAHLLRAGPLNEQQKLRAAESIERAARSQAQLIEDLLDVSRIVTGKFRLKMQDVDIGSVLRMAVESLRLGAHGKQVVAGTGKTREWWTNKEQIARLSSRTRAAEFVPVAVHDGHQLSDGVRWIDHAQPGCNRPCLPYIFICISRGQLLGAENLEGHEEAVHLGDVDPHQQVRIVGGVRAAIPHSSRHATVDRSDCSDRPLGIRHSPICGHREVPAGALEASPEIATEACMINNCLQRYRMERLQEQRTNCTDEHRGIGMYPPNRILLAEPTLAVSPDLGVLRLKVPGKQVSYGSRNAGARVDECCDRHVAESTRGSEDQSLGKELCCLRLSAGPWLRRER